MTTEPARSELAELCAGFEMQVANSIAERMLNFHRASDALSDPGKSLPEMQRRLSRSIQFLAQQRNQCTLVGRLSDEIISEILGYCMAAAYAEMIPCFSHKNDFSFPAAFSTCARWRQIAMQTPSLWYKIVIPCHPELLSLFEARSGNFPLDVTVINSCTKSDPSSLNILGDTLRRLVPRISHLFLNWEEHDHGPTSFLADHLGSREFQSLKSLHINDCHQAKKPIGLILNMPKLQFFEYHGDPINMPRLQLRHLLHLHLQWTCMGPDDILKFLSLFPLLQKCFLLNTEVSTTPSIAGQLIVPLPRLETFYALTMRPSDVDHLFRHLHVPPSASLSFSINKDDANTTQLCDLLGPLISSFAKSSILKPDATSSVTYRFESKSSPTLSIHHEAPSSTKVPLKLMSFPKLAEYPNYLSHLHLNVHCLPSLRDLIRILSSWSGLIKIKVRTQPNEFERFLDAFEEAPLTLCPRLRFLDCQDTSFSSARMLSFLAFRVSRGFPLARLYMTPGFSDHAFIAPGTEIRVASAEDG
ncbi:hypothetical protein SISSUDRAFT_1118312 [Sistotremastrum suecicum HHB10207 ss-3]|uniref:F-box domain-containing protein n=1 Tax=Sistotremastrum suecicum HHB10207 ss-3 TaxID=1314776 RepID=A0A166F7T1_9AGAM|nr:hypothetical protein SISSUDRAFT_1118312 [Sistotremastrum suecicum HHB10207 ss-3]